MDFSKTDQVSEVLKLKLKLDIDLISSLQPQIEIKNPGDLVKICLFLFQELKFDYLNCITAIDLGPETNQIKLVYTITNITEETSVNLCCLISSSLEESKISSISGVWPSADWHEREIFDLFGVKFLNHPDLRRILLPADWQGHPMRKDYEEAETYHHIKIKY